MHGCALDALGTGWKQSAPVNEAGCRRTTNTPGHIRPSGVFNAGPASTNRVSAGTDDPDNRAKLISITHEPVDVQDIPDALRVEQAKDKKEAEATSSKTDTKSVDAPTINKRVKKTQR